jgi:hypothetical protein
LTAINGTDWKLADGRHQKNLISPQKKLKMKNILSQSEIHLGRKCNVFSTSPKKRI